MGLDSRHYKRLNCTKLNEMVKTNGRYSTPNAIHNIPHDDTITSFKCYVKIYCASAKILAKKRIVGRRRQSPIQPDSPPTKCICIHTHRQTHSGRSMAIGEEADLGQQGCNVISENNSNHNVNAWSKQQHNRKNKCRKQNHFAHLNMSAFWRANANLCSSFSFSASSIAADCFSSHSVCVFLFRLTKQVIDDSEQKLKWVQEYSMPLNRWQKRRSKKKKKHNALCFVSHNTHSKYKKICVLNWHKQKKNPRMRLV